MTRWRLIKALLAVSAVAIVGLGVAAGVAASRDSGSDSADRVRPQDNDSESTAWLGILGDNSDDPAGVRIVHVFENTAATTAGLAGNDVITAIDGDPVADIDALRDAVDTHAPGDVVTLTVIKSGEGDPSGVDITLGEQIDHGFFGELHDKDNPPLSGTILDILNGLDTFLDGAFRYRDNNGEIHEVSAVAGTLIEISDDSITILTDATGERSFDLTVDTYVPDGLKPDDDVIIFSLDGEVEAVFEPGHIFNKLPVPNFHFNFDESIGPEDLDCPEGHTGELGSDILECFRFGGSICDEEPADNPDVEAMRDAICNPDINFKQSCNDGAGWFGYYPFAEDGSDGVCSIPIFPLDHFGTYCKGERLDLPIIAFQCRE